jgi:hypothetical protein
MTVRLAEASSVDVSRPRARPARVSKLRQVAASRQASVVRLFADWMVLRLRSGLSIEEYLGFRLFDPDFYGAADRTAFAGIKRARRILLKANYRLDLYGLIENKIACDFLLAAHGLPTMPTVALYHQATGLPAPFLLRSTEELREFLSNGERYPLFGKPLEGRQSLGSASFDRYDPAGGMLVTFDGRTVALDGFVRDVTTHFASGYLFQKRVSPHATVRPLCGDRLATVRVLTAATREGPQVLRASWKMPAGINAADNFWRIGNLLAQLDIKNGQVLRAVQTTRNGFEEITHHPDTHAALLGATVPHWLQILDYAKEGARVLADVPLLGWDIAPVDSGAVIVEVNHIPDFRLHQIADRRGIYDSAMIRFLHERKVHAADWRRRMAAQA